ncbi:hypothetical protein ANCDUO_04929 [Ancylostoma duodenale]|uniref:Uncharacterized protein n=1 Tax=Ancylostoma duodenale TaxID=51022 RepID=A0A0C2GZU5_9BILA|nr:hypothetical protein ANCDUO_04929 [Ancylostoma duodenale]
MLVDPIPRPEQVGSVIGLTQSTEDSHLINNFSPPLTTSSRSSVALDATPPLSSGGGAVLVVKQEHVLNGPPTNNFNALVNAAVVQAAELTNHNRLAMTSGYVPDANGHHDEKVLVDPATLSSGALTPTTAKVAADNFSRMFAWEDVITVEPELSAISPDPSKDLMLRHKSLDETSNSTRKRN